MATESMDECGITANVLQYKRLNLFEGLSMSDYKSTGLANKANNAAHSARSRANSFHADRNQSRHDLGGEGAGRDYKSGDELTPVRTSEGRGWAKMDAVTQAKTFTGKGG